MTKASWIAALIILSPLSVHQVDYRAGFSDGLSLKMRRASPAYAALEDASNTYADRVEQRQHYEVTPLIAKQIRVRALLLPSQERRLALKPMVLKQSFQSRPPLQQASLQVETRQNGLLPIEERKRILVQYFKNQQFNVPSVRDQAKRLIETEAEKMKGSEDSRVIIGQTTGTPITIYKPSPTPFNIARNTGNADNNHKPVSTATVFKAAGHAPDEKRKDTDEPSLSVSSVSLPKGRGFHLKGQLEVRDGLAFMGEETFFTLHRVVNGSALEQGRIWISEARFEISVREPSGELIAELHSRSGGLLGRGTVTLDAANDIANGGLDDLHIELTPVVAGAATRVVSEYSYGNRAQPVKTAMVAMDQNALYRPVNGDGIVDDPTRARRSTFIVRAESKDHWPTLALGIEGEQRDVRMYPTSLVKSFLDLAAQKDNRGIAEQHGIVWGRILKDGKPVSNVEVELAGNYAPVYFNELYLPDSQRRGTSATGSFAFLLVRPGVQAVRVRYKNKIYPAQIFPTQERHVSYVEIRLEPNRSVNVDVQDAFDVQRNLSAHVRFVGVDDEVQVGRRQNIHYPGATDTMVLEADAGPEYELSRVQILRGQGQVRVPLIKREWLQQMLEVKQVYVVPRRGTVVGFVTDQPFQVDVTGYAGEPVEIAYFDHDGSLVEGNSAPAGGGFILFNAPLGMQTLTVKPLTSNQTFTQTFVAEPEFVHVFKYSFGGA